jgi:hypothetical protein
MREKVNPHFHLIDRERALPLCGAQAELQGEKAMSKCA